MDELLTERNMKILISLLKTIPNLGVSELIL